MANHKSAIKRIKQNNKRRIANKYYAKTTRNMVKDLKGSTNKEEAAPMLIDVTSKLDKLAKMNIIHKNKASNIKSKLAKHVNSL